MFVKGVMEIEEKIALKNKRLSQQFQKWDFLKSVYDCHEILTSPWLGHLTSLWLGHWVGERYFGLTYKVFVICPVALVQPWQFLRPHFSFLTSFLLSSSDLLLFHWTGHTSFKNWNICS